MEIIVVRNDEVGGVGRTTIAAHIISFAAELGLKVAGASIDGANNLRPWMRLAGLPWVDALCDDLPSAETAPTVPGDVMRVRNYWHGRPTADDQAAAELESASVVIDRCNALRATSDSLRPVWGTPLGAASAGARAMRELAAEVLCRVGLLPTEDAPYERQDKLPSLAEREKQGVARLGAFFERFAAMKKAEAETRPPRPWMVEWARDVESSLAKK